MIIIYLFDKHVLRIYYVVGNGLSAGATKRGSQSKRRDRHHTQQMSALLELLLKITVDSLRKLCGAYATAQPNLKRLEI